MNKQLFKYIFGFVTLATLVLLLSACDGQNNQANKYPGYKEVLLQGKTMGTTFNVKVFVPETKLRELNLYGDVKALLAVVNQSMSTYIEDSEINRFNRQSAGEVMTPSADFRKVLAESIRLGEQTQTLDITMGPLIDLWGFGPDNRPSQVPSEDAINTMLSQIGVDKLILDANGVAKTHDDLEISMSAIAKGYGIDVVAEHLEYLGLTNYMVEIGGEIRVSGTKPDGQMWTIAIEEPTAGERAIHRVMQLANMSVATSGDYRIFYELDGTTYSHLIHPKTGYPIEQDLVSVTVLHPSAMTADGLATAIIVMGTEKAKAFAAEHNLPVYLISQTPDGLETYASDAFAPFMN